MALPGSQRSVNYSAKFAFGMVRGTGIWGWETIMVPGGASVFVPTRAGQADFFRLLGLEFLGYAADQAGEAGAGSCHLVPDVWG